MKARVSWNGKMGFTAIGGSNHAVPMDVSTAVGGDGTASSPMEMVLFGLAGCSAIDVVMILQKKRLNVQGLEILVDAERAEEHPKVFTKIDLTFVITGEDLTEKAIESAVKLSIEKYCSVAGMVNKTAKINWKIDIKK